MKSALRRIVPVILAVLIGVQPCATACGIEISNERMIRGAVFFAAGIAMLSISAVVVGFICKKMFSSPPSVKPFGSKASPTATLNDYVGGAPQCVEDLVAQLKNPLVYQSMNVPLTKGILLHGEPGCGKTHLARCIAGEVGCPLLHINGTDFAQPLVGLAKSAVKSIFDQAKQEAAKSTAKTAIIFIDEFDAIGSRETRIEAGIRRAGDSETINALLDAMDGFAQNKDIRIVVIAATNNPDRLDPAIKRPGRLDTIVRIERPNETVRLDLIDKLISSSPTVSDNELRNVLIEITAGMTPADIKLLFDNAGRVAIGQNKTERDRQSFSKALCMLKKDKRDECVAPQEARKNHIQECIKAGGCPVSIDRDGLIRSTAGMTLDHITSIFQLAYRFAQDHNEAISTDMVAVASVLKENAVQQEKIADVSSIYQKMYPGRRFDGYQLPGNGMVAYEDVVNHFDNQILASQ